MLAMVCAAAITVGLKRNGGGQVHPAIPERLSTSVRSANLPAAGGFVSLSVAGGKLIAVGGANLLGTTGRCDSATVNATTLRVSDVMHGSCGDPALYHEHVVPLAYVAKRIDPATGNNDLLAIRIAMVKPGAPDGYTVGPEVMTYPDVSDTRAEWLYGDGSLWIFDPDAHDISLSAGVNTGELTRVSTSTGKVLQRWILPSLWRPLLAVDADGLWIAPSLYTGSPAHPTTQEQRLYESLYLAVPGSSRARRARDLGPDGTRWMVAAGHTVWLEADLGLSGATARWRLQGPDGRVTAYARSVVPLSQGADMGEGPSLFGGDTSTGVYGLAMGEDGESIMWMDPRTLTPRIVKTLQPSSATVDNASTVAYDGAFFVLNPSASALEADTGTHATPTPSVIDRVTTARTR
jgi:hypothetical protein